eukprot:TRINITY_DN16637_c0_g1_i1.p1 TRINITY_DN16637_c0_g1~~TRINITY_DN16637_c0_g1_i1.p1  ORF type:complete len:610 (-),score=136.53 TRINITY_DN16637_c0_g1_i1:20-1630(-)
MVKELVALLKKKPQELGDLSSMFASRFNADLRGNPRTPFAADKRNDGSFKKWLVQCGFIIGPLFGWPAKNRCLVCLPGDEVKVQNHQAASGGSAARNEWGAADMWDEGDWTDGWDDDGWEAGGRWADASWDGGRERSQHLPGRDGRRGGAEPDVGVPLYVFLDASMLRRMMPGGGGGLLTFESLLHFCNLGLIICSPPEDAGVVREIDEGDRVIFVVTDTALDAFCNDAPNSAARKDAEWLRHDQNSFLKRCYSNGVLEYIETALHTRLMKLDPYDDERARAMGVSSAAVKLLDFALLWDTQIEACRRVLLITADTRLARFGTDLAERMMVRVGRCVTVVLASEMESRLAADNRHGGAGLTEVAHRRSGPPAVPVVLSAQVLSAHASAARDAARQGHGHRPLLPSEAHPRDVERRLFPGSEGQGDASIESSDEATRCLALRQELAEASELLDMASRLLTGSGGGGGSRGKLRHGDWRCPCCGNLVFASKTECFKCHEKRHGAKLLGAELLERMESASSRWRSLFVRAGKPEWATPD